MSRPPPPRREPDAPTELFCLLPSRQAIAIGPRLLGVRGFPQRLPIERDVGVGSDHQAIALDRGGLAPRVLDHLDLRIPPAQLLDAGHHDLELDPELPQNLSPLR